jgi:hypothetical protein
MTPLTRHAGDEFLNRHPNPCDTPVPVGDGLGGADPCHHRHCAVHVYKRSTERAFDRRLNFYLRTLIAEVAQPDDAATKSDKSDSSVQSLGEPLFELPLSGWYWRMARTDGDKPEVRASRSLGCLAAEAGRSGCRTRSVRRPAGLVSALSISICAWWSGRSISAPRKYLATVAGDATEIEDDLGVQHISGRDIRGADGRPVADHDLSGSVRPCAAQADFKFACEYPLRAGGAAGR